MERYIKLGDKLELLVGNVKCPSKVEEITAEGTLIISEPLFRSPLLRGDSINMTYYRRNGIYSCTVVITHKYLDRKRMLALLEVEIRSQIFKHQRREYVRFEANIPVKVYTLVPSETAHQAVAHDLQRMLMAQSAPGSAAPFDEALILDISGGGLRIASRSKVPVGTLIGCVFPLDDDEIQVCCQVMNQDYRESDMSYKLGCRYASIEERLHERIVRYIFDKQVKRPREQRR